MPELNILDYITIIEVTGEERLAFCEVNYAPGAISTTQLNSEATLVVIEYAIAFPPVLAHVHRWLADGSVSVDEIAEIQLSDEVVAIKIPQIANHPELVAQYRQDVLNNYRGRFNRLNPDIWDYINRYAESLDKITRDMRRDAIQLIRDLINRAIKVKLGDVSTKFMIRGNGDEIYRV